MNASDNLIHLSDSGAELLLDAGDVSANVEPNNSYDFDVTNVGGSCNGDAGTGILIDFSDEVQIPLSQGILLQAEIDDTFGIFGKAQTQGPSTSGDNLTMDASDHGEEDAARLIRSFISGRKSEDAVVTNEDRNDSHNDNASVESVDSDQQTVVELDVKSNPQRSPVKDGLNEVTCDKIDQSFISSTSGGSGSEIFDILNLSSFSIPDEDMDENKFIEDVKREDMVASSTAAAVVQQIKLDILHEEVGTDSIVENVKKTRFDLSENYSISSEMPHTSSVPSAPHTRKSSIKSSSRLSTNSLKSNGPLDGSFMHSSVLSGVGHSSTTTSGVSSTRGRLSTSNFGSPIRASYPMSNKFFMPTPRAKTPSGTRNDYHNRLSDSFCSPGRTGLMLVTGNSYKSPQRVPVRKSISAETLHYENCSPVRDSQRHVIKFSTPSVPKKSRHSVSRQSGFSEYPNMFGDDVPRARTASECSNASNHVGIERTAPYWSGTDFKQYRAGRLSYASSTSNSSIHTLSPAKSSVFSSDISMLAYKMNQMEIELHDKGSASTCQPIKATAIVPPHIPTKSTKSSIKASSTSSKPGLLLPGKSKVAEQQTSYRPITQPSPTISSGSTRPISQTTPTRNRYSMNTRSSGYGPQQNLNSAFGDNTLKSPNKITANIKAPAIPKSLKSGVPSLGSKLDVRTRVSEAVRTGAPTTRSAIKPPGTGLRRPMTSGASLSSTTSNGNNVSNKENKTLSDTTAMKGRIGTARQTYRP